ncbi:MAG: hypothetical protein IPO98_05225 [Saprospiraceae bacterium]|nr:hypothetical protein [Saprospiraceae bacterium]
MLKHESFIILLVLLISISEAGITQKKQTAVEGKSFEHNPRKKPSGPPLLKNEKYRNYDGTLNNIQPSRSEWGSTDIKLAREIPADYGPSDRLNAMAGPSRPSPEKYQICFVMNRKRYLIAGISVLLGMYGASF